MSELSVNIPAITTPQMIEVDRLAVEEYKIPLLQMMENAGRHLAELARARFLDGNTVGKHITFLAGTGGNGGGALVCARYLHNWGARVTVALTKPAGQYRGVPSQQLQGVQHLEIHLMEPGSIPEDPGTDLVVDGLIGYSLDGAPRGTAAELIRWANSQVAPILSLDIPSGLDATSGQAVEPTIRATATMTLALPKTGLLLPAALAYVGELYLADIGIPSALYQEAFGLVIPPLFADEAILRLG